MFLAWFSNPLVFSFFSNIALEIFSFFHSLSPPWTKHTRSPLKPLALATYPEELFGGAWVKSTICYVCLLGQVLSALNGRHHPLHSEESSQVGRVGGDDDESEKPPHSTHDASR